ncbi:MAG: two-component system NtrC family sensor kinase [Colwellia sp.]|jgi:two-component system NtrC family sensor kinase
MFEFWHFQPINLNNYQTLSAEFNFLLVTLSIIIATLASYSALITLDRVRASDNHRITRFWLLFGCFVMGMGGWAINYTGMLAYMMPLPMSFSPLITTLSVLPVFLGSYFTLRQISHNKLDFISIQLSALSFAVGIGAMHFIGMEAIQSAAIMVYNFKLFALSIILMHILASITLYLIVIETRITHHKFVLRVACAIAMGLTVSAMHYSGLISVSFYLPNVAQEVIGHGSHDSLVIPIVIVVIIALLVVTTILCAFIDKRLQAAELSAKESAIRENDIVQHLPDGLLIINSTGSIVSVNNTAQSMFNMTQSAMIQLKIEELIPSITYSKLVDDVVLYDNLLSGQIILIEGIKKNGEPFPIEAHFSKMTLVIDFQVMLSCVMRDITERVQLEKQLNQANKLESIGQLAAGIAHEINTPTQYVTDNTTFLKRVFASCVDVIQLSQSLCNKSVKDITEEDLTKIKTLITETDIEFILAEIPTAITQSLEGLHRISTIVKAMKSFSYPSKGEMQLTSIPGAIETTVTVARNEWRYIAVLETQFDDDLPEIMCIRDELNQVFLNIIVNAAHAIEDSKINDAQQNGKIEIVVSKQDDDIIIKITDNGKGMPPEIRERIFDPFYTTKGVNKGTGQGLNLAYAVIVDRHNGSIHACSEVGVGTTFVISLPIANNSTQEVVSVNLEKDYI